MAMANVFVPILNDLWLSTFFNRKRIAISVEEMNQIITLGSIHLSTISFIRNSSENGLNFWNYRFSPDLFLPLWEETILKLHNLYGLDGYLKYWHVHNEKFIEMYTMREITDCYYGWDRPEHRFACPFCLVKDCMKLLKNCHIFSAHKKFILD